MFNFINYKDINVLSTLPLDDIEAIGNDYLISFIYLVNYCSLYFFIVLQLELLLMNVYIFYISFIDIVPL
jgi:hypothetical protein